MRTTPQAMPVAPAPGLGLLEHDHVRAGALAALAELDGEVVGGREAVHAGTDDDETGRSGYHVELPPGQRRVKNEQMEGITARTGQPAVRHVAAVERAFAVIDALADGRSSARTRSRAARGINASTVSRLLATLAAARFVEHVPETGRYRLSLRLVELGNAVLGRLDLRDARPAPSAGARPGDGRDGDAVGPGEHDAVTVDFAHSSSVVQSVAQLGRPSVGHATAAGKVMLAFGDVELPAEPLQSFTPRTIATRRSCSQELERVRRRGYAEAREEREAGLAAVAAPVFDSRGDLVGDRRRAGAGVALRRAGRAGRGATVCSATRSAFGELGLRRERVRLKPHPGSRLR